MTKTNVYECGKNGQGEKMKINLRYMQKNPKDDNPGQKNCQNQINEKQHNEKHNYRYCSSQLLTIDDAYSLIIDSMTELNTSNACPVSSPCTPVPGSTSRIPERRGNTPKTKSRLKTNFVLT